MNIPCNLEAEADMLGSMMMSPDAVVAGTAMLEPGDFYSPENGVVFNVIRGLHSTGRAVDLATVSDALPQEIDRSKLLDMMTNVPSVRNAPDYAQVVARHAASRRILAVCGDASEAVTKFGTDPYEVVDRLTGDLATIDLPSDASRQESLTMEQIVETSESVSPWVVPGMLRRDWRAILVAGEGGGKSTVLRQIAMLAAQGLHPFKFTAIDPVRALIVDIENPAAAIAETGGRMMKRLQATVPGYDPDRLRVFRRPGGIDPRTRHDRSEMEREITLHRPDIVCIGPAYKMVRRRSGKGGMESHEEATDPVLQILDDLRIRHGFALVIEHHAPQGHAGTRDLRPYGSQRWLAWPEIGLTLRPDAKTQNAWKLGRFRGDRLITDWPDQLSYGNVWPWVGTWHGGIGPGQSRMDEEPF